jgi:phosphatidylglycerophosphatase A
LIILSKVKIPVDYLKNPLHFLSLGFGSGLMPIAPGTFGTLAAIPVYLLVSQLTLLPYLLITVFTFILGVYLCGYTSKALGVHDHSGIVWDEIVGFLITMIAVPVDAWLVLAGFVLFRFFDIVKPWPIRWVDAHLKGGFGIMFDDVLAGIFALIGVHLLDYTF